MLTSAKQPFCRLCGKPLKKHTELHAFGVPEGTPRSVYGYYSKPHPEEATTRAEAQRFINHRILSSRKNYTGHFVVTTWDGESYRSEEEFFCTMRCAASYGRFAVTHRPELQTQKFADAVDAQASALGREGK